MPSTGEEVGVAFVRLVPSMRGFGPAAGQALSDGLERPAAQAGEDASSSFGAKFKLGVAAVGVAAGALLAHGLSEAMGREKVEGKLAAQLGTTPAVAQKYGKIAGGLYANAVTEDFESAAEAVKAVVSAGLAPPEATNKQIQSIATNVSDLAATFDQDVGGVTNAVSQMLRTGLAKNAQEATDILTRGFQLAGTKGDDLTDTVNEYSVQFQALGLTGKQAMGLIQQGLQGGARDSDLVADSLKEFNLRARDITSTAPAGFKALGLNAKQMAKDIAAGGKPAADALQLTLDKLKAYPDNATKASVAADIFGTQSEDMQKALMSLDPSSAVDALGQVTGAATTMGDDLRDNASTRIEVFKRRAENAFVQVLGTKVLPVLEHAGGYVKDFGEKLKTAGHWVQDNQGKLEIAAGIITTVMLPTMITLATTAVTTTTTVIGGWIAQGAAAVASAARTAVANVGIIAGWVASAATSIASAAIIVAGWALMGIQSLIRAGQMAAAWLIALGPIGLAIAAVAGIAAFIILKWDTIRDWTVRIWTAVINWITGTISNIIGWTKAHWPLLLGILTGPIGLAVWAIVHYWSQISDGFKSAYRAVVATGKDIVTWVAGLPSRIVSALGNIGSLLYKSGQHLIDGFISGIKSKLGAVGSAAKGIVSSVSGWFPGSPAKVGPFSGHGWTPYRGKALVTGFAEGMTSQTSTVTDAAGSLMESTSTSLPTSAAAYRPAAATAPVVTIQAGGLDHALLAWLQNAVRNQGGGSAQKLLGTGA
jgi:phage-related minor tail protein